MGTAVAFINGGGIEPPPHNKGMPIFLSVKDMPQMASDFSDFRKTPVLRQAKRGFLVYWGEIK